MTDKELLYQLLRNIFGGPDRDIESLLEALKLTDDEQPLDRQTLAKLDRLIAEMIGLRAWFRRDHLAELPDGARIMDLLDHWNRRN